MSDIQYQQAHTLGIDRARELAREMVEADLAEARERKAAGK